MRLANIFHLGIKELRGLMHALGLGEFSGEEVLASA